MEGARPICLAAMNSMRSIRPSPLSSRICHSISTDASFSLVGIVASVGEGKTLSMSSSGSRSSSGVMCDWKGDKWTERKKAKEREREDRGRGGGHKCSHPWLR